MTGLVEVLVLNSKPSPDGNIIGRIPAGRYPATVQCPGEEVTESGHSNFWWVQIGAAVLPGNPRGGSPPC